MLDERRVNSKIVHQKEQSFNICWKSLCYHEKTTHVRERELAVSRQPVLPTGCIALEWRQEDRIGMPKTMSLSMKRIMSTFGGESL